MSCLEFFGTPKLARRTLHFRLMAVFACASLTCCSCTTMQSMARTEDFSEEIQRAKKQRLQQVVRAESSSIAEETTGVTRIGGAKPSSGIQQVGYQEYVCPPDAVMSCPPEPRTPVPGPNPYAVGVPFVDLAHMPSPELYCDEYLCDGGDRDWPVHYDTHLRHGLDTEDTIAEYVDHEGHERMKPSTKVCVYAPRFAAVRTVSQPVQNEMVDEAAGMTNAGAGDELRSRLVSVQKTKRDPTGDLRVRTRASGMDMDESGAGVIQDLAAVHHDKLINLFQDFSFTQFVDLDHATAARLNYGLGAAVVWSRDQNPIIAGQVETPTTGLQEVSAATITVIDDQETPGCLKIAKFADRKEAHPGDVITFTIRYQNTGGREVHYVRIVDNLTPRLDYIDDSTTSDRRGELGTEDNGEGSLVLTWSLSEPLEAGGEGTITFQARVR